MSINPASTTGDSTQLPTNSIKTLTKKLNQTSLSDPDRVIPKSGDRKYRQQVFDISATRKELTSTYCADIFESLFSRPFNPCASIQNPLPSKPGPLAVIAHQERKRANRKHLWDTTIKKEAGRILDAPGYLSDFYAQSMSISQNTLAIILDNNCYLQRISLTTAPVCLLFKGAVAPTEPKLRSVAWFNKSSVLISDSLSTKIMLIDTVTKNTQTFLLDPAYELGRQQVLVQLTPNSFLSGFGSGSILLTDTVTKKTSVCVPKTEHTSSGVCSIVPASGASGRVAVGYNNGIVAIYNSKNWKMDPEHVLWDSTSGKRALQWLPGSSSQLIVGGGSNDGSIYVYDLSKKNPLVIREKVAQQISSITFVNKKNLEFVATFSCYETPSIKVFGYDKERQRIDELKTLVSIKPHHRRVLDSIFSEGDNLLVTGTAETETEAGILEIWDLNTHETKTVTEQKPCKISGPVIR